MSEAFIVRRDPGSLPKFRYTGDYTVSMLGRDWQINFLTSGALYWDKTMRVDLFLVGGGMAGGASGAPGAGGNGGCVLTILKYTMLGGRTIRLTIGAGGKAAGGAGGATIFGGTSTDSAIYYALGGSGSIPGGTHWASPGSTGSSGGGYDGASQSADYAPGGQNGGAGGGRIGWRGSGATTRAFGEADGVLYAPGGAGAPYSGNYTSGYSSPVYGGGQPAHYESAKERFRGMPGAPNTGAGGGGGYSGAPSTDGGSGVILMRNAR